VHHQNEGIRPEFCKDSIIRGKGPNIDSNTPPKVGFKSKDACSRSLVIIYGS